MARTLLRGGAAIRDGSIQRDDLDVSTAGQALIRKIIAGFGIGLTQTGADTGTGDVTISANVTLQLGSVATTSGTSKSFSVDLTGYAFVELWFNGVSAGASGTLTVGSLSLGSWNNTNNSLSGRLRIDLSTGIGVLNCNGAGTIPTVLVGSTGITTATTTITITSGSTYDLGSIKGYAFA